MSAWKEGTESMLTLTLGERKYSADLSVDTLETGNLVVLIRELDIIEWGGYVDFIVLLYRLWE